MLRANWLESKPVEQVGWFHSEGVDSLPLDLLRMAREVFVKNLHAVLLRAAGAPTRLVFVHGHDQFGYQIGLAPAKDSVTVSRVGMVLDQPMAIVDRSREELWATARSMGVSPELFNSDYDRAVKAFKDTPVTGWDVVRYLSLGGGVRSVAYTEGSLVIDVTETGLGCATSPAVQPNAALWDDYSEELPDSPQHH